MPQPDSPLVRKLQTTGTLSEEARAAINALPMHSKHVAAGEVVLREGDKPHSALLVIRGCIFRNKVVSDGKRQIMSFHIAGDIPDVHSLFLR